MMSAVIMIMILLQGAQDYPREIVALAELDSIERYEVVSGHKPEQIRLDYFLTMEW
jgi:hypothetical protein